MNLSLQVEVSSGKFLGTTETIELSLDDSHAYSQQIPDIEKKLAAYASRLGICRDMVFPCPRRVRELVRYWQRRREFEDNLKFTGGVEKDRPSPEQLSLF